MQRILILGGTTEGRLVAERLAKRHVSVMLSLAGRTKEPVGYTVPMRSGGFGGIDGLVDYLRRERIDILVDATHPHAATISHNAAAAAERARVKFLALRRSPWLPKSGDRWIDVGNVNEAVRLLGKIPRRVFVTLGRNEIANFETAPQHFYLIRSVDPVIPPLRVPNAIYLTARGPFSEADEIDLIRSHRIDVVVAKNSGGDASYAKIAAAGKLRIDVVLIRQPSLPHVAAVTSVAEALEWLDHAAPSEIMRGV